MKPPIAEKPPLARRPPSLVHKPPSVPEEYPLTSPTLAMTPKSSIQHIRPLPQDIYTVVRNQSPPASLRAAQGVHSTLISCFLPFSSSLSAFFSGTQQPPQGNMEDEGPKGEPCLKELASRAKKKLRKRRQDSALLYQKAQRAVPASHFTHGSAEACVTEPRLPLQPHHTNPWRKMPSVSTDDHLPSAGTRMTSMPQSNL